MSEDPSVKIWESVISEELLACIFSRRERPELQGNFPDPVDSAIAEN